MTSIVIDTASFTPEQVKQILEFVDTLKKRKFHPLPPDFPRDDAEREKYGHLIEPKPIAKAVGCDGLLEEPFRSILAGAEPSVGNEPMKETEIRFKDYKPE